jgi:hypothetical protein
LLRTRQNPLTMEQARNCAVPVPLARLHVPRASQSRCSHGLQHRSDDGVRSEGRP